MSKKADNNENVKEVYDFRSSGRFRKKRQLEIWVDSDRKVHSNASGSITAQMKALAAMIEYIQFYATMCQDVSSKALNVDNSIVEMNEKLSKQLQTATNTLAIVDKDIKRKAAKSA